MKMGLYFLRKGRGSWDNKRGGLCPPIDQPLIRLPMSCDQIIQSNLQTFSGPKGVRLREVSLYGVFFVVAELVLYHSMEI